MRPLRPHSPLPGVLRLGRPSDIWFKPAVSIVVAAGPPNLLLLGLGRLDLAPHTMAGSLCALYAHNRPYTARARVLAWVVLGMVAGFGVSLAVGSVTTDVVPLVAVGALIAAAHKAVCEATRLGPPGNVVLTFVSSAALFAPQPLAALPAYLGLALAAGAWSWLVCMAPALLRPHGPERRAVARALRAAAGCAERPGDPAARAATTAALPAARQALAESGTRGPRTRQALDALLAHAESAVADPVLLRAWADGLRGNRPVPAPRPSCRPAVPPTPLLPRPAASAVLPLALRTGLSCALAGWACAALGAGRPYWALVTAASVHQPDPVATHRRGVQRAVGNLAGVVLFAALTPLAERDRLALVLLCLACNFGAEALIARNYWLGSVCVTPMALFVTEFARLQDPGELIAQRVADTLLGAAVGMLAAALLTDARVHRVGRLLTAPARRFRHGPPDTGALTPLASAGGAGVSGSRPDAGDGVRVTCAATREGGGRAGGVRPRTLAATPRHGDATERGTEDARP